MTHPISHRLLSRGIPLIFSLAATIAYQSQATLAQETLAPLPGQTSTTTPSAPLNPIPQTAPPAPTQAQGQTLQPLPGLAPLPGTLPAPQQLDPGLIAERDQLLATYQALQTRLQQAQAADTPAQPQTLEAIEQASARLQQVQLAAQLTEWTEASANSLLQTINGRPLNGISALPAGTQIAPRFVKMRLAANSYDRPSTDTGTPLYNIQQGAPILELATTQNGAWLFAWVPDKGFSYVLQSFVSPLEGE